MGSLYKLCGYEKRIQWILCLVVIGLYVQCSFGSVVHSFVWSFGIYIFIYYTFIRIKFKLIRLTKLFIWKLFHFFFLLWFLSENIKLFYEFLIFKSSYIYTDKVKWRNSLMISLILKRGKICEFHHLLYLIFV